MSTYRKHVSRVHEFSSEKRVKCDICAKFYNHEEGLKRHVKKIHGSEGQEFKCSDCGLGFAFKYDLNRHRRKVHDSTTARRKVKVSPQKVNFVTKQVGANQPRRTTILGANQVILGHSKDPFIQSSTTAMVQLPNSNSGHPLEIHQTLPSFQTLSEIENDLFQQELGIL